MVDGPQFDGTHRPNGSRRAGESRGSERRITAGSGPPILTGVDGRPVVTVAVHGVAQDDDLGVQAFARHLESAMDHGTPARSIVAGMRAFLEGKPHLAPPPPWPPAAPPVTGYRAVAALAVAAGLTPGQIEDARRASRLDLAGSAWVLDPADGLTDLLDLVAGRADPVLVADPDDPATGPVLDALELAGRFPVRAAPELATDLATVLAGRPALLIDADWPPGPAAAAGRPAGPTTALIDRFRSGTGHPDLRAADLPGLLPAVAGWLDRITRGEGAR